MKQNRAALQRLATAVQTKHLAEAARLAALTQKLTQIEADLREIRKGSFAFEPGHLAALSTRAAWSLRKERLLCRQRTALQAEIHAQRAKTARSFGEKEAAQLLLDRQEADTQRMRLRRSERTTLSPRGGQAK